LIFNQFLLFLSVFLLFVKHPKTMNKPKNDDMAEIARALMPQESMLEVKKGKNSLFIGIPKETSFQENRIALVPEAVSLLVNNGHEIWIEKGAGLTANFQDQEYSEAGAKIVYTAEEVFKADMILKVAPPSMEELEKCKHKQILISILQLPTQKQEYFKTLAQKKISALAYEYMKDKTGLYPVVQAMSEIVGASSILIAAEYLSNSSNGKGELLGGITGITPTEVVILGAGTVGESAARTALGLGASVTIFDNSLYKLRRLQNNLGTRVSTSILVPTMLSKALKTGDVVIGAIAAKEGRTPCVITEGMVSQMKSGSVIIDVSIDQGGCCETSEVTNHTKPIFIKHGVIHYCVPNIASRVARTASYALSNIFTPIILNIGEEGGIDEMLWDDTGVRNGVYLYKGHVTNRYISESFKMPFKDLDLLMASRI
jgi:alanine dehydrogenase